MNRNRLARIGPWVLIVLGVAAMAATAAGADAGHDHAAHGSGAAGDATPSFFSDLFRVYVPRRICMNNEPGVVWLHVVSDALIAGAYYSIPLALVYFVRKRRDLTFHWMFTLFAVFILACGTTHLMSIWAIWSPVYRLDGIVKLLTGVVSVLTAVLLWPLVPKAIALPSPAQLRRTNEALGQEVVERRRAEDAERRLRAELEDRVVERTAELARANEALRAEMVARRGAEAARARLAAIVESSDDAILGMDLAGTILSWNGGAEQLFGYAAADVVGRSILTIVPPDRHGEEAAILAKLRLGHRIDHFETARVTKDGRQIDVSMTASPIEDERGELIGVSKIARDITSRKRAEQERRHLLASERHARSEAERASRMKDEFLATLSHELRTPLNAILGWSQILRRPAVSEADVSHGLETVERNARAQAQLIDDLLDMSRIISGKLRLDVQGVDLVAVITGATESVRPAVDAKEIRLEQALDGDAGAVVGDAGRLQQVVWNLLSNAVKFTPRGGRIRVGLARRADGHVEVTVADNGPGIRPDFLPHVFERFRQADASTTRKYGGLGVGLAIVKSLVELHGGTVRVESEGEGKGATFVVELPVGAAAVARESEAILTAGTAVAAATAAAMPGDGASNLEGVRVLIVDDDPDARELVGRFLQDCGAVVTAVGTVADAMAVLGRERFTVLISDIGMPEEDGYTLLRQVRALPPDQGGDLPAIALTALARAEDRRRVLLAGFRMHLPKPVDPAELIAVVASVVGRT